ncbi:energy-coupling factor ABC transporter ATP-binding protein [Halomarina halobia]|uniref:Energy-coupling factor ABC transporter ATP-binding protein n=1 Tax=Halomarina halobia TaxID=3033386 RepID=A0ABD6ADQ2_9EURY|nr:ABC transporter ATP-binding protein [Halomarina sp. PSR21]
MIADGARALRFDGVEFSYVPGTRVLHGIDLTVDAGEFVTIIGQNGSGKSTLVKHINGLLTPDAGTVEVADRDGTTYSTDEHPMNVLARIVGYVFQNPDDQIFHTTVREEIEYGLKNVGVPASERAARVATVLDRVGLPIDGSENPFSFSKGQRQRLAIASVLAMRPQLICVDEPTTGQDRAESVRIMEILRDYNERGHTVVVITHDIALAAAYTDRVIAIKDGHVIADGPPERVFLDAGNLEETNIRPPQITQLGLALADEAPPGVLEEMWLTTADALEDVTSFLGRSERTDPADVTDPTVTERNYNN